MRILLVVMVGIVFVLFVVSFIALNTSWLDFYTKTISTMLCFKYIYLASMLILSSFLIAHARYHIKLAGESKTRLIQFNIGIFFGITVIAKLLMSYYELAYVHQGYSELSFSKEIKAENSRYDAQSMYEAHGILIEYYDFNKTKKIYEPSPTDILIKEYRDSLVDEMHSIPLSLVLTFLILIFSYWLGNRIASRNSK